MSAAAGENAAGRPFPWDAVLHTGLHLLRLPPRDFWALTPREFFAMAGGLKPGTPALHRAGLDALMRVFPDIAQGSPS